MKIRTFNSQVLSCRLTKQASKNVAKATFNTWISCLKAINLSTQAKCMQIYLTPGMVAKMYQGDPLLVQKRETG